MSDLSRAGSLGKGALRLKQVKVEKPRPLKMGGVAQMSPEDLLVMVDVVTNRLVDRQFDEQLVGQLANLSANLKVSGPQLEVSQKAVMDKLNSALMSACRDDSLDLIARVHMLEIIELRTMGWKSNENVTNYYKQKLAQIEIESKQSSLPGSKTAPIILNPSAPDFSPQPPPTSLKADLLKYSDNYPLPHSPPMQSRPELNRSKSSSKAESFSKFSNKTDMTSNHVKMKNNGDYHHQNKTSPNHGSDFHHQSKTSPGDFYQNKTSPTYGGDYPQNKRSPNHSGDYHQNKTYSGDCHHNKTSPQPKVTTPTNFSCLVQVGSSDLLTVSGANEDLVNTAKIVLHEFFNLCPPEDPMRESSATLEKEEQQLGARSKNISGEKVVDEVDHDGPPETVLIKPEICYEKDELMALSSHPLSKVLPEKWSEVVQTMPGVVRRADRAGPTSKIILKEMEEIRRQEAAQSKHV